MNNFKISQPVCVVANGDFPKHSIPIDILNNSKTIIACDGATNNLVNKGYSPNLIIGDLDSISSENKKKFHNIIIEKSNQEENDLRKSINYLKDNNINKFSIIAATGKREDHMLGNIFSLLDYKNLDIRIFTDTGYFSCIHKSQNINSFKDQKISLFSTDKTITITSNGLMYNFNNNAISSLFYGTLNMSTSKIIDIKISHGSLLIFQTYK